MLIIVKISKFCYEIPDLISHTHLNCLEWCHLVLLAKIPGLVTLSTFPKFPYVFLEELTNLLLFCILWEKVRSVLGGWWEITFCLRFQFNLHFLMAWPNSLRAIYFYKMLDHMVRVASWPYRHEAWGEVNNYAYEKN